jgi:protease-4
VIMRNYLVVISAVVGLLVNGCAAPQIKLFPDATDPLREFTLEGTEKGKVLVIPIRGVISDAPRRGLFRPGPSMVQEVVSQLRLAERDDEVRAVLLKIDSPGGSTAASDVLYHEMLAFKKRTKAKVVVAMMDVAASGAYYVALPSDFILAHPTTVTGSVGAIFTLPKVAGLMEKIGLDVEVNKSGKNKDMGSPFRETTKREQEILQGLANDMGERFLGLVAKHRNLDQEALADVSSGRVYLARQALQLGLVDRVGYLSDALLEAKKLAGLPEDSKVVVYRRTEYANDNVYNTTTSQLGVRGLSIIDLGLPDSMTPLSAGFYYLWLPAAGSY